MAKSRQVVKSKLNEWCDWRVDYVSKQVKSAVSKAFLRVRNNILNLYDGTKKTLTDIAEKEAEKRKKQKNKKKQTVDEVDLMPQGHNRALTGACCLSVISGLSQATACGSVN